MTPDNRNNEPLDAILRRAMHDRPGPATPDCADAESLAAYSDRSLARSERERLETHFADCMRCQLMLADIARAEESARVASSASEIPWYRRWRIAIPALTAVAAVLVFIAIRPQPKEEPQRDQFVAMAKNEALHTVVTEQAAAPAEPPQLAAPAPAPAAAASVLAMNDARRQATANRAAPASELAAPAPVAPASPANAEASGTVSNEIAMNEAKTVSAPRAEAMGADSSHTLHRQVVSPGAAAMNAQSGQAAPNAPAAGSFSMAERGSLMGRAVGGASGGSEVLVTISTPDRSVTWVIGRNGIVRRHDASSPGLKEQHSGVSTDLIAGSAPSSTVCWVVGRSGTIIRTSDGGDHWQLVTSPSADNLVGVSATSAKDSTITTAGGQSFATSDGGVTWRLQ